VIAALQDPRKEVMSIRNLFPDPIAMRLDEDAIAWKRIAFDEYRPLETVPLLDVVRLDLSDAIDLEVQDISDPTSERAD
jgi:hypothetical protein